MIYIPPGLLRRRERARELAKARREQCAAEGRCQGRLQGGGECRNPVLVADRTYRYCAGCLADMRAYHKARREESARQ